MWTNDYSQGSRTESRLLAGMKGLIKCARVMLSLSLALLVLLGGVLLPQLWEESSSAAAKEDSALAEPVYDLSLSEENGLLLVRTRKALLIRDLETGGLLHELSAGSDSIALATWIPHTRTFLMAENSGRVAEWNGGDFSSVRQVRGAHQSEVLSFAFTSSGQVAATASADRICLWNLADTSLVAETPMSDLRANSLEFSPDDRLLLAGCDKGSLRIFHADNLRPAGEFHIEGTPVIHCEFVKGGKQVLAAHFNGSLYLADAATGREVLRCRHCPTEIVAMAVSPDERFVAVSDWRKSIHIYSAKTLTKITCLFGHRLPAAALRFSQTGGLLYSGGHDGMIRTWDMNTFAEIGCYRGTSPNLND